MEISNDRPVGCEVRRCSFNTEIHDQFLAVSMCRILRKDTIWIEKNENT